MINFLLIYLYQVLQVLSAPLKHLSEHKKLSHIKLKDIKSTIFNSLMFSLNHH